MDVPRTDHGALVVLGMHRSGTSALAGLLADLGCASPRDPLDPASMNPKGFVESRAISMLDDALMKAVGSSWWDWTPLEVDPGSSPALEFVERASQSFLDAYGDASLPVLKDPRMCRLVPFWVQTLSRLGRSPGFVLTHRDPAEVAASLDRWAGYGPEYGTLLWLRYVLDAESSTRGRPRVFTSYHRLLEDPASAARSIGDALSVTWPVAVEDAVSGPDPFVEPALRRSVGATVPSPWAHEVLQVLDRWAEHGEDPADHPRLDRVRTALDEATPSFAGVVARGRQADIEVRRVKTYVETTLGSATPDAADGGVSAHLAALDRARNENERVHAATLTDRNDLAHRVQELRTRLDEVAVLEGRLRRTEQQLGRMRRRSGTELRAAVTQALGQARPTATDDAGSGAPVLSPETAALRAEVAELRAQNQALLTSNSWRVTAPLRGVSQALRRTRGLPQEAGTDASASAAGRRRGTEQS